MRFGSSVYRNVEVNIYLIVITIITNMINQDEPKLGELNAEFKIDGRD